MEPLHSHKSRPEAKRAPFLAVLPECVASNVFVLNCDNKRTPEAEAAFQEQYQNLLSGDSDITINFLQQMYARGDPAFLARAEATKAYLNDGFGPREMFNIDELANMIGSRKADVDRFFHSIVQSFPPHDRKFAWMVLEKSMGFSSLDSWGQILDALDKRDLLITHQASLASSLVYLGGKGVVPALDKARCKDVSSDLTDLPVNSALVLDNVVWYQLQVNPKFREEIKTKGVSIIVPVTQMDGLTAFGTELNHSLVRDRVNFLLESAWEKCKKDNPGCDSLSKEQFKIALDRLMLNQAISRLEGIQIPSRQIKPIAAKIKCGKKLSRIFCNQISPNACRPKELLLAFKDIPSYKDPSLRHVVASLLISQLQIYSQSNLRSMLGRANAYIEEKVAAGKTAYFYVPERNKSYGFITSLYATQFNVHPDRIIGPSDLPRIKGDKNALIVMLDDLAGTGESIVAVHKQLFNFNPKGEVCYLPLISSNVALNRFNEILSGLDRFSYVAVDKVDSLGSSKFWSSLDGTTKNMLLGVLGRKGYGHLGLCSVMPHSVPNNVLELLEVGNPFASLLTFARKDSSRELREE